MQTMRKFLLILLCLSCCAGALHAQGRHEINAFLGGYKAEFLQADNTDFFGFVFGNLDFEVTHSGDLADLYEPHYFIQSSPVLTLCYHYSINSWLRVGAQADLSYLSGKITYNMGNRPRTQFKQTMLDLLPEAKFMIPGSRHFRLYGKVAAGVQMNMGTLMSSSPVEFAWEIAPIGAEWGGQRFYGNAEFCWGNVLRGIRIGMGVRF